MYETFFQFNARPFLAAPFADRYFSAASAEHARSTVTRCVERGEGPAVILGAAGTGKSTLCHVLAQQMRDRFAVVTLASARLCTRRALLQNILFELKLPYRDRDEGELRLSLIDFLSPSEACPNGMLLLVDEAHMLPLRLLEEIRMITNLVRDGQPRVRLVLLASMILDERLASPRLESFNQRIAARCYLQSMNREDTRGYVIAQISAVGGDPQQVFTSAAFDAIYRATDGIPRLVNQVCDHVLMMAAIGQQAPIDASGIEEAWADLQQLPAPWVPNDATASDSGDILEFGELDDADCGELDGGDSVVQDSDLPAPADEVATSAAARLQEIEENVSEIAEELPPAQDDVILPEPDDQFRPESEAEPEIELVFHHAHNPFSEPFEEEEDVIVDPFASLETLAGPISSSPARPDETIPFRNDPASTPDPVSASYQSSESDQFERDEHGVPVAVAGSSELTLPGDDRDLIEIHDEDDGAAGELIGGGESAQTPQRRRYRQLFASLRKK